MAFDDVADGINRDAGVNGMGTLRVSMGSGSVAPPIQVAFSATVASPYGTTTIAVWSILVTSQGGVASDQGACVLASTLLGSGRATANFDLGGGVFVQPCPPLWRHGPINVTHPNLGTAGIEQGAEG